jgi:hypothetical protein
MEIAPQRKNILIKCALKLQEKYQQKNISWAWMADTLDSGFHF